VLESLRSEAAALRAGECGVADGEANRGGLCSARPGSGVSMGTGATSSSCAGVGICPTAGVRDCTDDGTGELARRAVDSARGTDCEMDCEGELRPECPDDGTARGFVDDSGASFAMFAVTVATVIASVACCRAAAQRPIRLRLLLCNVGDGDLRRNS
jgi:hypothetical protein